MEAGSLVVIDAAGEFSMLCQRYAQHGQPLHAQAARNLRYRSQTQRAAIAARLCVSQQNHYMGGARKKDPNSLNKVAYDYGEYM